MEQSPLPSDPEPSVSNEDLRLPLDDHVSSAATQDDLRFGKEMQRRHAVDSKGTFTSRPQPGSSGILVIDPTRGTCLHLNGLPIRALFETGKIPTMWNSHRRRQQFTLRHDRQNSHRIRLKTTASSEVAGDKKAMRRKITHPSCRPRASYLRCYRVDDQWASYRPVDWNEVAGGTDSEDRVYVFNGRTSVDGLQPAHIHPVVG